MLYVLLKLSLGKKDKLLLKVFYCQGLLAIWGLFGNQIIRGIEFSALTNLVALSLTLVSFSLFALSLLFFRNLGKFFWPRKRLSSLIAYKKNVHSTSMIADRRIVLFQITVILVLVAIVGLAIIELGNPIYNHDFYDKFRTEFLKQHRFLSILMLGSFVLSIIIGFKYQFNARSIRLLVHIFLPLLIFVSNYRSLILFWGVAGIINKNTFIQKINIFLISAVVFFAMSYVRGIPILFTISEAILRSDSVFNFAYYFENKVFDEVSRIDYFLSSYMFWFPRDLWVNKPEPIAFVIQALAYPNFSFLKFSSFSFGDFIFFAPFAVFNLLIFAFITALLRPFEIRNKELIFFLYFLLSKAPLEGLSGYSPQIGLILSLVAIILMRNFSKTSLKEY